MENTDVVFSSLYVLDVLFIFFIVCTGLDILSKDVNFQFVDSKPNLDDFSVTLFTFTHM